jgi:hypothetical protein
MGFNASFHDGVNACHSMKEAVGGGNNLTYLISLVRFFRQQLNEMPKQYHREPV